MCVKCRILARVLLLRLAPFTVGVRLLLARYKGRRLLVDDELAVEAVDGKAAAVSAHRVERVEKVWPPADDASSVRHDTDSAEDDRV